MRRVRVPDVCKAFVYVVADGLLEERAGWQVHFVLARSSGDVRRHPHGAVADPALDAPLVAGFVRCHREGVRREWRLHPEVHDADTVQFDRRAAPQEAHHEFRAHAPRGGALVDGPFGDGVQPADVVVEYLQSMPLVLGAVHKMRRLCV